MHRSCAGRIRRERSEGAAAVNFVLQMMNSSFQMMNFTFKMMSVALSDHESHPRSICRHPNPDTETGEWITVLSCGFLIGFVLLFDCFSTVFRLISGLLTQVRDGCERRRDVVLEGAALLQRAHAVPTV